MALCECGCGGEPGPGKRFVRGHNPKRVGIPRSVVPREKICEVCDEPYQRKYGHNRLWLQRRTCSPPCAGILRGRLKTAGVPDEKVCERCGLVFRRGDLASATSNTRWLQRRFCSSDCQYGDERGAQAGRKRARVLYPGPHSCEECGEPAEIHHRNGDTFGNGRENIAFLCRKHHMEQHRLEPGPVGDMSAEQIERRRAQSRERGRRYRARKRGET